MFSNKLETQTSFDENGYLMEKESYLNRRREGEWKVWHKNGRLKIHTFCRNGKLKGEYKIWYENGQMWTKLFYKNGRREGERKVWSDSGQLFIHEFYPDKSEFCPVGYSSVSEYEYLYRIRAVKNISDFPFNQEKKNRILKIKRLFCLSRCSIPDFIIQDIQTVIK